jgi:hypothetical protein
MFLTIPLWYGLGVFSNGNVDFIKKMKAQDAMNLSTRVFIYVVVSVIEVNHRKVGV